MMLLTLPDAAWREETVTVNVRDLPEVGAEKIAVLRELELVSLTAPIRAERGVRSAQGAVVYRVSDRVSQNLGIRAGDVIVQVNRAAVEDAQGVERLLTAPGARGVMRMFFERAGQVYTSDFIIK